MKRVLLFIATNLLVMITIQIVIRLLGLDRYLTAYGIDYARFAVFCLVWGMGGAFISLLISKISAKFMLGVQTVERTSSQYGWLVMMVDQLSAKAGLSVAPEVGIYQSPEVNAFATGPSQRHALVAFSTGLLQQMSRDEIEGVAGHEIAHIRNGDMVTMTLLQGVINAFVIFFSQVIARALSQGSRDGERSGPPSFLLVFLLNIVLTLLGSLVVCAFSRWREYRADRGGARYAGKADMLAALQRLSNYHAVDSRNPSLATLKISGGGIGSLFATHPPLEKRIAALKAAADV